MAGHPRRIHDLHPTQFSFSTFNGGLCFTYFKRAQGRRLMITDGSSAANSSLITVSQAARSYGSTTRTRLNPIERQRLSKSIFPAGSPLIL